MSTARYQKQVELVLDVLPAVAAEESFALHGGTAINLFVRDMPRLSVDIDLTYLPIENRETTLANIERALKSIQSRLASTLPDIRTSLNTLSMKLLCSRPDAQIKIEVNTVMRGALGEPKSLALRQAAQEKFDRFVEMRVLATGQLYGGKVCAALDRQHPRDLFDIKYMMEVEGFSDEIKRGFLLGVMSSDRPMHEVIQPSLHDQRETLENHFVGMTEKPFTYDDFEAARAQLITAIRSGLDPSDRALLVSFKEGSPAWSQYGFEEFERFPAVQWKLQNILRLKSTNPGKHDQQLAALRKRLQ